MLIDIIYADLHDAAIRTTNESFDAISDKLNEALISSIGSIDHARPLLVDALKALPLTCANIHTAATRYQQNTNPELMTALDKLIIECACEAMGIEAPPVCAATTSVFHTQIIEALDSPRGPLGAKDYAVREALDSMYKKLIEKAKEQMVDQNLVATYAEVLHLALETHAGLASLIACQHQPVIPAEGDDGNPAHIDTLIHAVATEVHEKTASQQPPLRQFTHPTLLKGVVGEAQRTAGGFVVPQFGIDQGVVVTTGKSPLIMLSASNLQINYYAEDGSIAPLPGVSTHLMSDSAAFEQEAWLITYFPENWDVIETCVVPVIDLDKMVAYLCMGQANTNITLHWLYGAFPKMEMDPEHIVGYVSENGLKLACATEDAVARIMTLVMDSRCCNYQLETIPDTDELHEILANACGLKTPWSSTRQAHGGIALADALRAAYFGDVTKDMVFDNNLVEAVSTLTTTHLLKLGMVTVNSHPHATNILNTTDVGNWVFENTKMH